jgi:hypothetical protein
VSVLLLILVVIVSLQAVALVIGIVARSWVLRSESFEMRGIDVARATDLVAGYLRGVHDHRFGFPTGVFEIDQGLTAPGRVVAREINLKGSAGMAPIVFGLKLPLIGAAAGFAMGADADDASAGCMVSMIGGMTGAMLGGAAAVVLVVPFAFLTMVEMILRVLMRGEIAATIDKVPEEEDSVRVRFEMRGLSAFGVEHQLRRGMEPPRPKGVAPPPQTGAPEQPVAARFDRLNAIYAAGASIGLIVSIVAFILIGNAVQTEGPTAQASSYYAEEEYEEPYEEEYEEYEEEPYEEEASGEYEEEEYEEELTPYEEARAAYRHYWASIDRGYYGAAYDVYYHTYATEQGVSKGEFIDSEYEYLPDVGLDTLTLVPSERRPTNPNELWLYAEIPIRDGAGEYAGICRLFYGDLRMFHAEGSWWYRPGEAFGREPSFGRDGGGIRELPASSERCD